MVLYFIVSVKRNLKGGDPMATIELIVLGILKKEPLSAYDIQKLVEYRNISKWVKISTPSIYKKVLQLEEKGLIKSDLVREGRMAQKAVYSLTESGEQEFHRLMLEIAAQPIRIFLDFNAVIVNLPSLPPEEQQACLDRIEANVKTLRAYLEENLRAKEHEPEVPEAGLAVLRQQLMLAQSIETWAATLRPSGEG